MITRRIGIAGLGLILLLLLNQDNVAAQDRLSPGNQSVQLCPDPEKLQNQRDPDHYKPDPRYVIANSCNTCADPQNAPSTSCSAYASILLCQRKNKCSNSIGTFKVFDPFGYAVEQLKSHLCHYVTFALAPTIGVEDRKRRDIVSYWDRALFVAKHIRSPALKDDELALAINPSDRRGQHQLHIHVGKLFSSMRQKIEGVKKNTNFTQVAISIQGGVNKYQVRYLADSSISPPEVLGNRSPFELVSKEFGEANMQASSIIVARSQDNQGFYILSIKSVKVEDQLDYTGICNQLK